MDKIDHCKESPEIVIRDSLIEISYELPNNDLDAEKSPKSISGVEDIQHQAEDVDEIYRSKLISLSYSPPADVKVKPGLPSQPSC